jgi:hypothetical protein
MKLRSKPGPNPTRRQGAFTLIDVMMGVAISAVMFITLYLGLSQGFSVIGLARENLRATQILQEKMETIWLYTWSQINSNGFMPTTFQAPFYPAGAQGGQGLTYKGTVTVTNSPVTESYKDNLKLVVVRVEWTSGSLKRQRQMSTLVSQYGLHNYVY